MTDRLLRRFAAPSPKAAAILRTAYERSALSARGHARVLRLARTIADLDASDEIEARHLLTALTYRGEQGGGERAVA
jgi:magnesium chelatase family protein